MTGLEELRRIPKAVRDTFKREFRAIERELKALEVIKDKKVNPVHVLCYDLKTYNTLHSDCPLTQEEYDLLKEELE